MEKIFRKAGDNPNHPYIIKVAFTGNAAFIIQGQTLHSAFNFPYSNQILSLSDKIRDERRTLLKNLKAVIIDEMSLVKSDMLYQLHFRLMKDIFQNETPFGGVAVFLLGDILQLEPVKGTPIYGVPRDPKLKLTHTLNDLWKEFKIINLQTNHRQGADNEYANILNRIRVGEQTGKDIEKLETRIFKRGHKNLPKDALYISGTNAVVNKVNKSKLNEVSGKMETITAIVYSETKGEFKPRLDKKGDIAGTNLKYELSLKKGCRIMLTYNLDVCDSLTNGSQGEIIEFIYKLG